MSDEVPRALEIAIEHFGMTAAGNFEGSNILHIPRAAEETAEALGITPTELEAALARIKNQLYAMRAQRVPPALDDKVLTSWNGLMLASLAEAARVLDREDYLSAARRAGDFVMANMVDERGRLYRTHKDGRSKLNAYLDDYANLIDALLELYQTTFDERYFVEARRLADFALARFSSDDGGFYDTSDDHETLIVRPRNLQDNVTPSGNAMMAKQLLRLSAYTGDAAYQAAASTVLRKLSDAMGEVPQAFAESLNAADMYIRGLAEVAVVGDLESATAVAILAELRQPYRPNLIAAWRREDPGAGAAIPLLRGRAVLEGGPTVYVCRNFACRLPVTSAGETAAMLADI